MLPRSALSRRRPTGVATVGHMPPRLTPAAALLLTVSPLLWAGNAVVGRMVRELMSPLALNFVRWLLAFVLLLPFAAAVLRPSSALWPHWRRYGLLGLLGVMIRRNPLLLLLAVELLLNSANLSLVAFSRYWNVTDGQVFALVVMVVAATEVVIGLGLVVAVFRQRMALDVDQMSTLKG